MTTLLFWIFLRFLTSIFAAYVSSVHPMTFLEQSVALLPPSSPLSTWIERAALSPWLRWDAVWYQRIVERGYDALDGTAQFHPLYPWLASIFTSIGAHPLFSLLLVSSISCLGFMYIYHRLARLELSISDARFSLLVILLAPSAFVLFAPYSEALFLLCAASCLLFARQQRWWLAGLAAGLATLTRQQGLFLIFPLAYELWEVSGGTWIRVRAGWGKFLSLLIIPLSYAFWIFYRHFAFGDLSIGTDSLQSLIYSLFISPSAAEVVPQQSFVWPWKAIGLAIHKLVVQPDVDIWVNCLLAVIFLILFGFSWNKMRPAYRWYSALITLVSFSYYTGPFHPYMGLPRHLLLAFPVFVSISPILNRSIIRPIYLTLMGISYLFLIYLFSLEAWVV
jgi:Gpi18-like mannosyltransferase